MTTVTGGYTGLIAKNNVVYMKVSMDGLKWVDVPIPPGTRLAPEQQ